MSDAERGSMTRGGNGSHWAGCEKVHWDCALDAKDADISALSQQVRVAYAAMTHECRDYAKNLNAKDAEIAALRAQVEALKAARKAWYTTAKFRWKGTTGAAKDADARCRELGVTVE